VCVCGFSVCLVCVSHVEESLQIPGCARGARNGPPLLPHSEHRRLRRRHDLCIGLADILGDWLVLPARLTHALRHRCSDAASKSAKTPMVRKPRKRKTENTTSAADAYFMSAKNLNLQVWIAGAS